MHKIAKNIGHAEILEEKSSKERFSGKSHGSFQLGGTNACFNLICICGHITHIDSDFLFYAACENCKNIYKICCNVELIEIENISKDALKSSNIGIYGNGLELEDFPQIIE